MSERDDAAHEYVEQKAFEHRGFMEKLNMEHHFSRGWDAHAALAVPVAMNGGTAKYVRLADQLESNANAHHETQGTMRRRAAEAIRELVLAVPAGKAEAPDALIESLRVAMLGTTDGGFLDPRVDGVPVGEMFRLAAEWVEYHADPLAGKAEAAMDEAVASSDDAFELGRVAGYDEAMREVVAGKAVQGEPDE